MPGHPVSGDGTYVSLQVTFKVNFVRCGAMVKWHGDASGFGMSAQWVMRRTGATTVGFDFFGRASLPALQLLFRLNSEWIF